MMSTIKAEQIRTGYPRLLIIIWDSRTMMDEYRQMMKEFSSLFLNCFMYGIKVVFQELQVVHAKSHVDTIKNWSKLIKKYIEFLHTESM